MNTIVHEFRPVGPIASLPRCRRKGCEHAAERMPHEWEWEFVDGEPVHLTEPWYSSDERGHRVPHTHWTVELMAIGTGPWEVRVQVHIPDNATVHRLDRVDLMSDVLLDPDALERALRAARRLRNKLNRGSR